MCLKVCVQVHTCAHICKPETLKWFLKLNEDKFNKCILHLAMIVSHMCPDLSYLRQKKFIGLGHV